MKRMTVVGTGFGGLTAVRTLRKLEPTAEITVIGRQSESFYYPSLVFFAPSKRPGQRLGEKAVDALLKHMAKRDISTHLGHKLKGFEAGAVITEGGVVEADLIVFMPGMK